MAPAAFLVLSAAALWTGGNASTSGNVQVIGRHRVNDGNVEFDMPGVRIQARVSGASSVSASMSKVGSVEDLFVVFCNGEEQMSADVPNATFGTASWTEGAKINVPLCSGLDPRQVNDVEIFKSTEAMWNARNISQNQVTFHNFVGKGLKLEQPPKRSQRHIEFLGDSITAGFCNLCDGNAGGVRSESHLLAWPTLTCQSLHAECHVTAWSGYGMVENCCGGETLASDVWLRSLGSVPSDDPSDVHGTTSDNQWDFSSWKADAVVINLGTNDKLTGDRAPLVPLYNATYLSLVKDAAKAYGPDVQFFLACGPMSSAYCEPVQWVIEQAASAGIKANFLDHRGFNLSGNCCGHPGADVDILMAKRTVAAIEAALDWTSEQSIVI